MRFLLALIAVLPLAAQETPAPAPAAPQEKAAAAAPAEEKAASPAPTSEPSLTGSVDVGYRWLTDIRGNFQSYRSIINLGEGPKLFGADFVLQGKRFFDRVDVNGFGWGGDPYNTV